MAFVTEYANQAGRDIIQYGGKAYRNGIPQISAGSHNFAAGRTRRLHSTTELAGSEGENRASNGGSEARCQSCGGRNPRGLEPGQPTQIEYRHAKAVAEPAAPESSRGRS